MRIIRQFLFIVLIIISPKLLLAKEILSFEGQVDFSKKEFSIALNIDEKSSVAATAQQISDTGYHLSLDIDHVKTPLFDLLSKIESSVEIVKKNEDSEITLADTTFRGKVWSQYSLVDYKPVHELFGNFEIKDQRLQLMALSFGSLNCNGYIDLVAPYELDLDIDLFEVGMSDFLNFWGSNKEYESSGIVSGEIKASGTLENLALKGNLESRNGFVQKLDFDAISLNIEGIYPHMQIAQSTISKSDGVSFSLNGSFDLSDKENFRKQIKALTIAPLVSDSGAEREWTFKRLSPEEESGVTELKYQVREGDALGIGTSASDESDMFGFERTRKF